MPLADGEYMDRALRMAALGRGLTSPNPLVGAVVISPSGVVVGGGHGECLIGDVVELVAGTVVNHRDGQGGVDVPVVNGVSTARVSVHSL